jgi:hypothetical protein
MKKTRSKKSRDTVPLKEDHTLMSPVQNLQSSDTQLGCYTDKKERKNFLIDKEIQSGSGAKSCMRKGFQKYGEMYKYLFIYGEAVRHI